MAMHDITEFTQKLADTFTKQGNIATVESTTTASKAYAVDEYLIYAGVFYKVTTAITSGGTIVTTGAGANVTATNVTDEMGGGVPAGGTAGQIIIKNSSTDGDASWQSLDASPTTSSTKPVESGGVYTALAGKTDIISSPTNNNLVAMDANGNIKDSGKKASDFSSVTTTTTDPGEGSVLATNSLLIVVEE